MGIRSALSDLRELRQTVVELFDDDRTAEAEASLQIARSAQKFSRNTKEVVDDKLSFSATLMRAGEVQAANRLLAEVEHEVREEEAALLETVNEVKVTQSLRRERMTRLRFARMLAVAVLGSGLLTFSAAGMAVAGFLRDRAEAISPAPEEGSPLAVAQSQKSPARAERKDLRQMRIGDVNVLLTKSQFKALKELTIGGSIDADGLADFLSALPDPLADRIEEAITVAETEVTAAKGDVETVLADPGKALERKKRAAKKAAAAAEEESSQPEEETTPEPTPSDNDQKPQEEDGGDSGETEEKEGDGGPPLPINP